MRLGLPDPASSLPGLRLTPSCWIPTDFGMYVLDVSGHGVAAALLAVAATRLLSAASDDDSILLQRSATAVRQFPGPEEVARRLDQRIPWNPATSQFLTLSMGFSTSRPSIFDMSPPGTRTRCFTRASGLLLPSDR